MRIVTTAMLLSLALPRFGERALAQQAQTHIAISGGVATDHRYAFRINGTDWRVPDGATAVDDGFGGKAAWITVPDRGVGR